MSHYAHLSIEQLCALLVDRDNAIQTKKKIIQSHRDKIASLERQRSFGIPKLTHVSLMGTGKKAPKDMKKDIKVMKKGIKDTKKDIKDEKSTPVGNKINTAAWGGKVKPPRYSDTCRREENGRHCRHNACNYFYKYQQAEYGATRYKLCENPEKLNEKLSGLSLD